MRRRISAWISRTAVIAGVLCAGRIETRAESPCAKAHCAAGTHCEVLNGNEAQCVPNDSPKKPKATCASLRCVAGTHCEERNGQLWCYPNGPPKNPCASIFCFAGAHCEVQKYNLARCVANVPPK